MPTATNWRPSHATSRVFTSEERSVQIIKSLDVARSEPAETNLPAPKATAPVGAPRRRVVQAMPGVVLLASTMKSLLEVALPPAVATLMRPVVAPAGTVTLICVGAALTSVAATLLKLTVVAPATKFRPWIDTLCPAAAAVGVKPEMSGGAGPAGGVPDGAPDGAPPPPPPPPHAPRPAAKPSTARFSQRRTLRVDVRRPFISHPTLRRRRIMRLPARADKEEVPRHGRSDKSS